MANDKEIASLDKVIEELLEKKQLFPKTLYGAWEETVGVQAAKYSQPRTKIRNILYVNVTDPVWKHHLILQKDAILERLNKFDPEKPLKEIRFRIGEIRDDVPIIEKISKRTGKRGGKKTKKRRALRALTSDEKKVLSKIEYVDLRKVCRLLLRRVK